MMMPPSRTTNVGGVASGRSNNWKNLLDITFHINRTNQTNEVTKDPAAFIVYIVVIRQVNLGESHQQRDCWDSD